MTPQAQSMRTGDIHVWQWKRSRFADTLKVKALAILGSYVGRNLLESDLASTPNGKPYLRSSLCSRAVEFNISHSDDTTVMAVSCEPVGIDIAQCVDFPEIDALAAYSLAPTERFEFAQTEPALRSEYFVRCWTRKEAYLKAIGCGLRVEPRLVDTARAMVPAIDQLRLGSARVCDRDCYLYDLLSSSGQMAAIASPVQIAEITLMGTI